MQLAKKHFDIPMILTPENMASPDLDELSGMTYLSYFMKVNSPGYQATLKYVKEKIPGTSVGNFQVRTEKLPPETTTGLRPQFTNKVELKKNELGDFIQPMKFELIDLN